MRAVSTRGRHEPAVRDEHPEWQDLLVQAVNTPGVIADAYRKFWNYSSGNQILALFQCLQRKIEPGPINTFLGWKDVGRSVRKGEKALTLCMPVTVQCRREKSSSDSNDDSDARLRPSAPDGGADTAATVATRTQFVYRARWFALSQTQGKPYQPAELPRWSESRALDALKVERVEFRHADGNVQGYAAGRQVAVSPIAFMPHRTLIHELAHVVLGHTEELARMEDDDSPTPRDLREVEAECVAMICCSSLGLGGEEFSRGYVQHWLKGQTIPERSSQKIFKAADQILRAGRDGDTSE
jgi:antirestriction protein ArdC